MVNLNPNCSETVVRLKRSQIKKFNKTEKEIYDDVLREEWSSFTPVGGYSELRGNHWWLAHYFYQSVGNKLVLFAYWMGIDFDTGEPWHGRDIMDWSDEELVEALSEVFTMFENEMWKKTATSDERMAWKI